MGRFQEAGRAIARAFGLSETVPTGPVPIRETVQQYEDSINLLQERLAELELALEDAGWQRLSGGSEKEFSAAGLKKINELARLYWLKNPLIKRAILTQTQYVFGQGVNIRAMNEDVNTVIQAFLDDEKNKTELTSHQARMIKETELQLHANLFFVFFTNISTGSVRVRTIDPDEIISGDIISNPEDKKDPWFYKRVWMQESFDLASGTKTVKEQTAYYPDWRYRPTSKPATIGGHPVYWDRPVYHVAVNKLSDMRFGVSEVYAAMDWARAYKDFLTDWATIVKSYAKFAWNVTTKGGRAGVTAAKERLATTLTASNPVDRNPTPATGSAFVATEGVKMEPIKTAGATTKAEDGRRLLLMVSAGTGIFEHYFGDPSTGNLATAKSMERPMELMFKDRQTLWRDVFMNILNFIIEQAVRAASGKLSSMATLIKNEYGEDALDWGTDGPPVIDVDFPDILEKDVTAKVDAIIKAGTLDGKSPAGLDLKTITKMLLVALGEDDVDAKIEDLFPEGWEEERAAKAAAIGQQMQPAQPAQDGQANGEQDAGSLVTKEVARLKEAITALAEAVHAA